MTPSVPVYKLDYFSSDFTTGFGAATGALDTGFGAGFDTAFTSGAEAAGLPLTKSPNLLIGFSP